MAAEGASLQQAAATTDPRERAFHLARAALAAEQGSAPGRALARLADAERANGGSGLVDPGITALVADTRGWIFTEHFWDPQEGLASFARALAEGRDFPNLMSGAHFILRIELERVRLFHRAQLGGIVELTSPERRRLAAALEQEHQDNAHSTATNPHRIGRLEEAARMLSHPGLIPSARVLSEARELLPHVLAVEDAIRAREEGRLSDSLRCAETALDGYAQALYAPGSRRLPCSSGSSGAMPRR